MDDLISRAVALQCIKESRDGIDWGQSEDGDAFMHYTGALYRTMASAECVPSVDAVPVVHGRWLIRDFDMPVFMKESLRDLMGADFSQEFPWEV